MIECYQVHALPNLLKYISYTYPKPKTRYFRDLVRDVRKLEWRNAWNLLRRKLVRKAKTSGVHLGPRGIAEVLTSLVDGPPVVVDYGSGLAYISYEIAGLRSDSAIFLLDVESSGWSSPCSAQRQVRLSAIPVTKENIHPELPDHNMYRLEVAEHLAQPLKAYDNIFRSLYRAGPLYGRFDDHQPNMYYVSLPPVLCARLAEDFEQVDQWCYRKGLRSAMKRAFMLHDAPGDSKIAALTKPRT